MQLSKSFRFKATLCVFLVGLVLLKNLVLFIATFLFVAFYSFKSIARILHRLTSTNKTVSQTDAVSFLIISINYRASPSIVRCASLPVEVELRKSLYFLLRFYLLVASFSGIETQVDKTRLNTISFAQQFCAVTPWLRYGREHATRVFLSFDFSSCTTDVLSFLLLLLLLLVQFPPYAVL